MPELSRFNGIIVTMYWEANEPHHAAHFHVRYARYRASYSIEPVAQLIVFDDKTEQVVNFEPVLYGEVFGPLRDLTLFNQVQLYSALNENRSFATG